MQRATSPTGASPAPTSPPSWAAAAAKEPGQWPRTTRTRPRWGSRRPAWRGGPLRRRTSTGCGSPPPHPPISTRPTPPRWRPPSDCPRPRPPSTSAARCVRAWVRCWPRSGAAAAPPWWWRPTNATACPPVPTRPPAGTPRPPSWWVTGTGCWPSSWPPPRPATSSWTVGGPRATGSPSSGRSASARTATWPSAATPSTGPWPRPASPPPTSAMWP